MMVRKSQRAVGNLIFTFLFIGGLISFAGPFPVRGEIQAEADTLTAASRAERRREVMPKAGPRLVFAKEVFDFGEVISGEKVNCDFQFTNSGKAVLEILEVKPDCGCTQAGEWEPRTDPGKSGWIRISLNTKGMRGEIRKAIHGITNVPGNPKFVVWLEGRVQEPFEISPRAVTFGLINPRQNLRQTVTITNRLKDPMFISNVRCKNPEFIPYLKVIKAGQEFELIVEVKPGLSPGKYSAGVEIQARLAAPVKIWIPVSGYVPPAVDIRPRRIIMRAGPLPEVMQKIISVRYTKAGFLKLSELTVNPPEVKLELVEKIPDKEYRIILTFPRGFTLPKEIPLAVTFKTNEPSFSKAEIPIRVDGYFVPPGSGKAQSPAP